jgi:hypothetical protein
MIYPDSVSWSLDFGCIQASAPSQFPVHRAFS